MDQAAKHVKTTCSKLNLLNLFPFKLCVICRHVIYRPTLKNRITQQKEVSLSSN